MRNRVGSRNSMNRLVLKVELLQCYIMNDYSLSMWRYDHLAYKNFDFCCYVFFLNNDLLVRTQSETFNSLPVQLVCQKPRRYHIITWSTMAYQLTCIAIGWSTTGIQIQSFAMFYLCIMFLVLLLDPFVVQSWMLRGTGSQSDRIGSWQSIRSFLSKSITFQESSRKKTVSRAAILIVRNS